MEIFIQIIFYNLLIDFWPQIWPQFWPQQKNIFDPRHKKKTVFTVLTFKILWFFNGISTIYWNLAPQVGFEPTAYRLTVECSTTELLGNIKLSFFSRTMVLYNIVKNIATLFCKIFKKLLLYQLYAKMLVSITKIEK